MIDEVKCIDTVSVNEVWIRSFGIHVAALASFGHLMSLQGSANSLSALVALLCCFTFPEMALAHILIRTLIMAVRIIWRREHMPFRFFAAACLGSHASSSSPKCNSIPLVSIRPSRTVHIPSSFSVIWVGRSGLLLAFLAQYAGSAALWIKLVFHVQDRSLWFWHIDLRTFEIVVGGLVATMNSILILMIGGEWKLVDAPNEDGAPERVGSSDASSALSSSKNTIFELEIRRKDSENSTSTVHKVPASRFVRFQAIDSSFGQLLDGCFPVLVQKDLELGILLYRVFVHITLYYRMSAGCPPILQFLSQASLTFDWTDICADRADVWDPSTFSAHPRSRNHLRFMRGMKISAILFNVGVCRILIQLLFKIIVRGCEKMSKPLLWKAHSLEHWVLSGRSVLSFPLTILLFACCPVWIMSMIELKGWVSHAQSMLQRQGVEEIDRIAMSVLMWKDPWQDTLYLI